MTGGGWRRWPAARRLAATVLCGVFAAEVAIAAPAGPALPRDLDPALIDELTRDLAVFTEAVKGYRSAATHMIQRQHADKLKTIRAKYEPQIAANEDEERQRRLDAVKAFELFLQKHPDDKKWTPDAIFRLAELYYEKSFDEYQKKQEAYQIALDSPNPPADPPPKADYSKTVELYRRLLVEFPNYRLLDATYYLLGFCLGEMGQEAEAKQALLALTCGNRYRPLDPPAPKRPATGVRGALADTYAGCEPVTKESKFLPEAWTRVGEMHFDEGELEQAISAYSRVLAFTESPFYDKALYKLAWSFYRDNRFTDAIREFDRLVKWADEKKLSGKDVGSDLRPEAITYLAISFAEPDWDGDTQPDGVTGLARAEDFYRGRESEAHVREVFQRLADILFDSTKYNDAIAVYKAILTKWPYYADAPKIQDKVVRAYERDRNLAQAARERELLGRNYSEGTEWFRQNATNPEALAVARQLAEDALLQAATNVHVAAQACKDQWAQNQANLAKLEECKGLYRTAGELYEKYLNAYPNSSRAYEFSSYYADALYFSGQTAASIKAYEAVRDSQLDNRFQQMAALQIVKSYEELIEQAKISKQIEEPPLPDESNTKPPVRPLAMPELYQKYVAALDWYVANIRDDRVGDMQYASAFVMLRYRNWPDARARLKQLTGPFCTSKPTVGFQAYDAILKTYFIDYSIDDEEQKDCALGRLLMAAEEFSESPCSKLPQAAEFVSRIGKIRASVKSTVIKNRLALALENEEKGTDRQLTQCREGAGGIALTLGGGAPAGTGKPGTPTTSGPAKVSTEIDEGLALDLIDMINANPKDADAPANLNNACLIYERLYKPSQATQCYERLAREYPDHPLARDALWNAARNHEKFFEFEKAVAIFERIATEPKFADFEHRKEALGLAATLLDNDQQYTRAAVFYRRYSDAISDKPDDSAQAYFYGCSAFEKLNDRAKQSQCLRDFIKRFGQTPQASELVVEAYMKLAVVAEKSGDKRATLDAYKKVRDEFVARRLPAATPAAAAAAKAEFLMLDERYRAYQARSLNFVGNEKKDKKTFEDFTLAAKTLSEEYQKVWDYKDATWTLASFLRQGDIYYDFAQKLVKAGDNPPAELLKLAKQACRLNPDDCGVVEAQYKDAIFGFVTPVEDEAKKKWRATLDRATQLGVTNQYVKKARENLSKYLPDEFPYLKDERIALEQP